MARTGGPRGNAHLTAWTGLLLLVLFVAEFVTLTQLRTLLTWHIAIGALLVPPTLLKTASVSWRILGYYTRRPPYVQAGPPPVLLRVLGPVLIAATLSVLGSGLALILIGPTAADPSGVHPGSPWQPLHEASALLWLLTASVHVLTRVVPALQSVRESVRQRPQVPGRVARAASIAASAALGIALALTMVALNSWTIR